MPGVVTKMTIIRHPVLMYRLCGLKGIVRVVRAKQGVPFLTIMIELGRV
jgi:hypothetical protein